MSELVWIDERDAVTLHSRLLALYGGAPGCAILDCSDQPWRGRANCMRTLTLRM